MEAHEKLAVEMAIDEMKWAFPKLAETARDYYNALKNEGFSDKECLYMTNEYILGVTGIKK
jgi:hypothetical protein